LVKQIMMNGTYSTCTRARGSQNINKGNQFQVENVEP